MRKFLRLLVVFGVFGLMVFQSAPVGAQSNALAIAPRKDYSLKPGESVSDVLIVTNRDTNDTLNLKLTVVDFQAKDESGTPDLLRNKKDKTPWSLKSYMTLPEQVAVGPNQTVRVPITIKMPSDIGAGSYYSAIEYSAVNPATNNQVNVAASGVTLVFVKVPGEAKEDLELKDFGAYVPDASGLSGSFAGLYFGKRPRVLAYLLQNNGNVAEQPNASIEVKNSSGKTVYTVEDANPKKQLALRGQTRRFDACIVPESSSQTTEGGADVTTITCGDTKLSPGRYTAELTVIYGENGSETRDLTAKTTFWYLPFWFLGTIGVGILILAGLIFYIVRRVQNVRSRKTHRR